MHSESLQPGTTYRDFEILAEIGAGSFARVYKVLAPGHDRPLALKVADDPRMSVDVIKRADWIIDLGPEAGDEGGRLVVQGTPEAVAEVAESHTGRYLREVLVPAEVS